MPSNNNNNKWDDLKLFPDDIPSVSKELKYLQDLVFNVFEINPQGRELLKILLDKYLYSPVCPPDKNAAYGYYREGQNSLLLKFLTTIEQVKLLQQQKNSGDNK